MLGVPPSPPPRLLFFCFDAPKNIFLNEKTKKFLPLSYAYLTTSVHRHGLLSLTSPSHPCLFFFLHTHRLTHYTFLLTPSLYNTLYVYADADEGISQDAQQVHVKEGHGTGGRSSVPNSPLHSTGQDSGENEKVCLDINQSHWFFCCCTVKYVCIIPTKNKTKRVKCGLDRMRERRRA